MAASMSWKAKGGLLLAVLFANIAILWWRIDHQATNLPGLGPHLRELGQTQVDTVIAWRNAPSIALNSTSIQAFVKDMPCSDCGTLPKQATNVGKDDLSEAERSNLFGAIARLLEIYGNDDPAALYDFMLSHSNGIEFDTAKQLESLIASQRHSSPSPTLNRQDRRELFLKVADQIGFDSHWDSLVEGSGCVRLWRMGGMTSSRSDVPLGGDMVGLFKNQTRFHQLFSAPSSDSSATANGEPTNIVADVRYVVKHDSDLQSEPSLYAVRFILDRERGIWHPAEMIHVPTVSGNSPMLLF
jgi:hypothetical protein